MTSTPRRSLILAGFMATGKTTIGQLLAEHLKRSFVDTDSLIVERTGISIPEIFSRYGEGFFRIIEKGICHELAIHPDLVISTGGGALMDADSRKILTTQGFVVCLLAEPAVIEQRIHLTAERPLAPNWRELLAARMLMYESLPYKVDTSHRPPQEIAEEILSLWFSTST